MENELEDGTRATFISRRSHPSLCSVRHRLCAAPMPVTTPPGRGRRLTASAHPSWQATPIGHLAGPEDSGRHHKHQFADGERRDPCRHGRCPGQRLGAHWPR